MDFSDLKMLFESVDTGGKSDNIPVIFLGKNALAIESFFFDSARLSNIIMMAFFVEGESCNEFFVGGD
jgi:hypothetical protein